MEKFSCCGGRRLRTDCQNQEIRQHLGPRTWSIFTKSVERTRSLTFQGGNPLQGHLFRRRIVLPLHHWKGLGGRLSGQIQTIWHSGNSKTTSFEAYGQPQLETGRASQSWPQWIIQNSRQTQNHAQWSLKRKEKQEEQDQSSQIRTQKCSSWVDQ